MGPIGDKNVIQSLCLPQDLSFTDELFFRGRGLVKYHCNTGAELKRTLVIASGDSVSFDTYFNMFPVFKWIKYTRMLDLELSIVLKGSAEISLIGIDANSPEKEVIVATKKIHSVDAGNFKIYESKDLAELPDLIYLSITAVKETHLIDILISTSAQRDPNLNIACCFCTFKREADIKRNIENLLTGIVHNETSSICNRLHVYVSDNGQTLPLDLYENEPAVHLFYNKNYGGSAGFTRCMIESCFRNEGRPFSHILLMDDDALILPEVVERTVALISILNDEYKDYMVGGALLSKETPYIQSENGVFLDVAKINRTYIGKKVNLLLKDNLVSNESSEENRVNYNGWWYTCIPANLITESNLPLPLFIHYDDQEYGLRNGGKFIRMNGICAWHPSVFGASRKKSHMTYYNCRNRLIVQASHYASMSTRTVQKYIFKLEISNILNYMYENCEYVSKGLKDFYRGVNHFKNLDPDELNKALMKDRPFESCTLSADEIKKIATSEKSVSSAKKNFRRLLNWFVPAYKGKMFYSQELNPDNIDMFGAKVIYLVDPVTGKGQCYRKSYKKAFKCLTILVRDSLIIATRHKKIYKEWHKHIPELQSCKFWEEYLEI